MCYLVDACKNVTQFKKYNYPVSVHQIIICGRLVCRRQSGVFVTQYHGTVSDSSL